VRVWLLGRFRVSVGTHTVEEGAWRLRKAAALVKLLALAPGHHLHRERAMDLLWPDHGRHAAANSLSQVLHAARRTLGPDDTQAASSYVASQGEQLVLCPGGDLWLDVEAFEEAAATARRSREPAAHRAALNLYAGELLPKDPYEEWAEVPREGLRQLFLALLVELASLHEERGEYGSGIEALRRAVVEEPTREDVHIGLMRLHALSGRRGEALGQYERLEKILSQELAAEPGVAGRRLYEQIASGRFPPVNPPPAADSTPQEDASAGRDNNLPAQRSSFVGQERELGETERDLAMTRLLTLTGSGGSGKTRLAMEVARDCVGAYPDGVWLVELAGLSEGGLVAQKVAAALGVAEQTGRSITDTLVGALRDKGLLLVLDNCEHLIDAAARLVDALLDSCPRLRVLATSREPLELAGEVKRSVPPLSAPDPGHPPTVRELEGYESVRLFVERGRNKASGFALTPENARAVAGVCRRLEGIPLAIELAAARVGVLSVEQISEGLKDPLKFVRAGNRTATPRQRTLRGTLDWSYELLGASERELFRKLSVFASGFSLEMAEAVGSGGGEEDVLALLPMLVDKSLVTAQVGGTVRYGMLEPVRQYAREKLEASGKADAVGRRHAAFFLALAEEADPELRGGVRQWAWLERLEAEHDNLRAALSWSLNDEPERALRLAAALARFWEIRAYFSEGRGWLEAGLRRSGRADAAIRARASTEAGTFAWCQGNYDRAIAFHREALTLYRGLGDERGVAFALIFWACQELEKGGSERAARAAPRLEEALALGRKLGDELISAFALTNLGEVAQVRGNYERALACCGEALSTYRKMGDSFLIAQILTRLGSAAANHGDQEAAARFIGEGLPLAQKLGSGLLSAMCLEGLAAVYGAKAEGTRVARLYGAAEALRLAIGATLSPTDWAELERNMATARATLDAASWEAAWAEGRAMTPEQAAEYALSEESEAPPAAPSLERPPADEPTAKLSRREKELAELLARGLTNRRIAKELVLSERTVENHVRNILKKLKLSSRSEVAAWVEAQRS
jgi:predicted ATPase/DNA-binding SARP family transcriptional activator/DNA-binding CsgD family transcriptional regulator